jgi:hypothetical protein
VHDQGNDDVDLAINLRHGKLRKLLPRNDSDQSLAWLMDRTVVTFDSAAADDNTAAASDAARTSAAPTGSLECQRCSSFDGTRLDDGAAADMSSLMAVHVSDDPNKDFGRRRVSGVDASWGAYHEAASTTAGVDVEAGSSAEADGAPRGPDHSGEESTLWAIIGGGGGGGYSTAAAAAAALEEGSVDFFFFGNGGDASTAEAAGRLGDDPPPEPRCGDPLCHKFGMCCCCCCCCSGRRA